MAKSQQLFAGPHNNDLGFGGLVLSASSNEVSLLLRAFAARRQVHILSRPQIRTLDNQVAQIQVGQQVPIVNGITFGGPITRPTRLWCKIPPGLSSR